MDALERAFASVREFLDVTVFQLGASRVTLWVLLYVVLLLVALIYVSARMERWLRDALAHTTADLGARTAVAAIARYVLLFVGVLVIVQTAGIDLTTLNVLAGAVGLGVGIGMQAIASNFVSGLVLLLERPVKVGDRIEVAGVEGRVARVGARSTTVVTNDNIAIIIPNAKLVGDNVINWSYTGDQVRFRIPVSVAYGSDVRLVERLLLQVAGESPDVLSAPAAEVRFLEFGDSGLLFELWVWTTSLLHRRPALVSALNFAIYDKFAAAGVQIPFPQRDVHVRTWPAGVPRP